MVFCILQFMMWTDLPMDFNPFILQNVPCTETVWEHRKKGCELVKWKNYAGIDILL